MMGYFQIVIGLLCVYLFYKGIEIFQIAYVSDASIPSRKKAMLIGVIMIVGSVVIGLGAIGLMLLIDFNVSRNMENLRIP